jgi:signal transduction histidine kinase
VPDNARHEGKAATSRADSRLRELLDENARLSEETHRRQRWSDALAEVTAALLSGADTDILELIADRAANLIGADFVSVITPRAGTDQFVVQAVHGKGSEWLNGRVLEPGETLAPTAIAQRRVVVLDGVHQMQGFGAIGPIVMMPLMASGSPIGVLSVARRPGSTPFRNDELAMVSEFGRQASVAMELARAQADSRRLEIVEERNRIARDLHDHVIQRLFVAGLTLSRAAGSADERTARTIDAQVDAIDAAIGDIRTAVFTLRSLPAGGIEPLRSRVLKVMGEFAPALEEAPHFSSSGPVELFVGDEIGGEVIAVVRELMSNVVKHARARTCCVDLSLVDGRLVVTVQDNGRGVGALSRRSGLDNIGERAERLDGRFDLSDAVPHGTLARWTVPISGQEEGTE